MKTILVTGGAGFIGVNLINKLLEKKNHIICIDNFFTSNPENIKKLEQTKNLEIIRHDITFPIFLEVDEIYNLACPASPIHYQKDPVQTLKASVNGSINLLGLAKRTKSKIFQASTSEIYGDPEFSPQKENYWGNVNPIGIRSCYDEGKRCAETLFFDYYRQHKIRIKIARIFNTYGPYMAVNDGRVVSNFINNALINKPIEIYGSGEQTRSFCYIDDLTEGIIKIMKSSNKITGPINLGNNHEINILTLANTIKEIIGSKSKIIFKRLPLDDPKKRKPDITQAWKELKWKPKTSLKTGLEKTIKYFEDLKLMS